MFKMSASLKDTQSEMKVHNVNVLLDNLHPNVEEPESPAICTSTLTCVSCGVPPVQAGGAVHVLPQAACGREAEDPRVL